MSYAMRDGLHGDNDPVMRKCGGRGFCEFCGTMKNNVALHRTSCPARANAAISPHGEHGTGCFGYFDDNTVISEQSGEPTP